MSITRIVIADDEQHVRHVVGLKLGEQGYDVLTARNGQEALRMATEANPDLVVTDLQMPNLSGLELAKRLGEGEKTAHIPIVLITGRGLPVTASDLAKTNIKCIITKPFSPRQLIATIEELLERAAPEHGRAVEEDQEELHRPGSAE